MENKTKLWSKPGASSSSASAELIHAFTAGEDRKCDLRLAKYDIRGTIAHVNMLAATGIISDADKKELIPELKKLPSKAEDGKTEIEEGMEDTHTQMDVDANPKFGRSWEKGTCRTFS